MRKSLFSKSALFNGSSLHFAESLPGHLPAPRRPHPEGQGLEEAAFRCRQAARASRRGHRQGHDRHHRCRHRRGCRAPRGIRAASSRVRLSDLLRISERFKNKTLCTDLVRVNKKIEKSLGALIVKDFVGSLLFVLVGCQMQQSHVF